MERVIEPELMGGLEQAEAYANADFEEPHRRVIELFDVEFPGTEIKPRICSSHLLRCASLQP